MRKAPRYELADLPENTFGKVVGVVRPSNKRLLEAPLTGRLCVYYEVYVDAMSGESLVRTLAGEQEGIAFVLVDGEARALVDPAHALLSTEIDVMSTSTLRLVSDRQQALLVRFGLSGERVRFSDGLRYREAVIEADKRIAVFGGGVREPDPEADSQSYRGEGVPTRLCLIGTSKFPLFISDDPRAL
jgi:hypothetical protein